MISLIRLCKDKCHSFLKSARRKILITMDEIKNLWREHRVHGLELIFDTTLLAFRYLSISYWLRTILPSADSPQRTTRDNAIDLYCIIQLFVLFLVFVRGFSPIVDSVIAAYILFEIYLSLLNIVFIGKFQNQ